MKYFQFLSQMLRMLRMLRIFNKPRETALMIGLITLTTNARAIEIRCNSEQSKCVTNDRNLTPGDRVGVFNRSRQLVAIGKIESMRGVKRSVKIYKSYGTIYRSHTLALLSRGVTKVSQVEEKYRIFTPIPEKKIGFSAGVASLSVGEYLSGTELSGYGQKIAYKKLNYVLRGTFIGAKGKIYRDYPATQTEKKDISMVAGSLLLGLSSTLFEQETISFRGEVGVGESYVLAKIGGDARLMNQDGWSPSFSNGFNHTARATISMLWNLSHWKSEVQLAQTVIQEARISTIALGLSRKLP